MTPEEIIELARLIADVREWSASTQTDSGIRYREEAEGNLVMFVERIASNRDRTHRNLLTTIAKVTNHAIVTADAIRIVHDHVDLTDPNCPVGVALTKAGLERRP